MESFRFEKKIISIPVNFFPSIFSPLTPQVILELTFKGGYLDFSHLTELKNMYITEIYMKKKNHSTRIKNHEITKKKMYGVPLIGYVAS